MQRKTERKDELERLRRRYAGRAKEGKSRLLDEFCEHHGYERKYAIKLLQGGVVKCPAAKYTYTDASRHKRRSVSCSPFTPFTR